MQYDLVLEIRQTARSLLRSPGFLLTAILSLALAIGGSAVAFSVLDAIRFRTLPFKDSDRLVLVSEIPVPDGAGQRTMAAS